MSNSEKPDTIGGVVRGLVVLVTLLAPIAALMYAHFSAQTETAARIEEARAEHRELVGSLRSELAATRSELRLLRADLDHHVEQQKSNITGLSARLAETRSSIDSHSKLGIGGLPHPAGVVSELKVLERDLALINQITDDRWRANDMKAWVKLLKAQNPELDVPSTNGDGR